MPTPYESPMVYVGKRRNDFLDEDMEQDSDYEKWLRGVGGVAAERQVEGSSLFERDDGAGGKAYISVPNSRAREALGGQARPVQTTDSFGRTTDMVGKDKTYKPRITNRMANDPKNKQGYTDFLADNKKKLGEDAAKAKLIEADDIRRKGENDDKDRDQARFKERLTWSNDPTLQSPEQKVAAAGAGVAKKTIELEGARTQNEIDRDAADTFTVGAIGRGANQPGISNSGEEAIRDATRNGKSVKEAMAAGAEGHKRDVDAYYSLQASGDPRDEREAADMASRDPDIKALPSRVSELAKQKFKRGQASDIYQRLDSFLGAKDGVSSVMEGERNWFSDIDQDRGDYSEEDISRIRELTSSAAVEMDALGLDLEEVKSALIPKLRNKRWPQWAIDEAISAMGM